MIDKSNILKFTDQNDMDAGLLGCEKVCLYFSFHGEDVLWNIVIVQTSFQPDVTVLSHFKVIWYWRLLIEWKRSIKTRMCLHSRLLIYQLHENCSRPTCIEYTILLFSVDTSASLAFTLSTSLPTAVVWSKRQGKFIYIAHFIHGGNSKCFT